MKTQQERLILHDKLTTIMGGNKVYYQPPENIKLTYPCIRYSMDDVLLSNSNNSVYKKNTTFSIILIDKKSENIFMDELLKIPTIKFDRMYISNGLYHTVFTVYI